MLTALTEKQKEYIRCSNRRWNLKHGATRSGKTFLDYYLIPLRIRDRAEKEGINLILGNTQGTIQRNLIVPMQQIWGSEFVTDIRSNNTAYIFGQRVYCLGADKSNNVDRIRGASVKYCYGDEVATWNPAIFEMLKSRLDKPYSMFEGTTNPRSPTHWLKKFIDSDADVFAQHYSIDDNTFLDEKVKEEMKKEYTGVYYDRFIRGLWVLAEGLIYPMFQDALEVPPEKCEQTIVSLDYGTMNAFAALVWKKHGDVWYATKGYYYSGRNSGVTKTDYEYGEDLESLLADEIKAVGNSDAQMGGIRNKIKVIIDPSAASFIALLKKKPWAKVIKADNAVLDGIRETATAIQKGLIKINPKIKEWQDEAGGYVWDDKIEDVPVKENDHYMDATRYFVRTMGIAKPKAQYQSLWL